jgi:hypothetical protein
MASENLPSFNAEIGPHSAKYFRAVALSKKLMAERQRLFEEGQQIRKDNPRGLDAFNYQYATGKPRELNAAEAMVAEFVRSESETGAPVPANHEALERAREIGASTQQIDDAVHQLGERMQEFFVRANREYVTNPEVKAAYEPVGRRIASALVELAEACNEHDAFVEELRKRDVHHFSWLQLVERPSWNNIRRMLRSAFEAGHISKSELDQWRNKE